MMQLTVKLSDVAEKAGVSLATASLVFNERPGVNKDTRERVLGAAAELDYTPNKAARSLAMNSSTTIGLVVTDIENPFFGSLTRYIDEYARKQKFSLILAISRDDPELENRIIENFIGECVDGIIVVPTQVSRGEFRIYETLGKRGIPVVFATTYYPGFEGDYVMTDLALGSYRLTKYLLELGHRDIAFLASADRNALISRLRISGYERAFVEGAFDCDPSRVIQCTRPDFQSGYLEARRLLEGECPDAIIAINDILALGAQKAFKEAGFAIPKDISIAGYDDVIFSSISDVPFTTVRQNISEIARLTVELAIGRIRDLPQAENHVLIAPELMVRETTGLPGRKFRPHQRGE
jgi:LacI family transcriptional regulator